MSQLSEFLDKKVIISQVRSESKLTTKQKGSLIGLGLRGIGSSSNLNATKEVLGMVKKVNHIVKISLA